MNKRNQFAQKKKKKRIFQEYGEYYCSFCDWFWTSRREYELFDEKVPCSEECEGCGYNVVPKPYFTNFIEAGCSHKNPEKCDHRRYGWYKCVKCENVWESAYTFCDGWWKVLYSQQCKECETDNEAYFCDYLLGGENDDRHKDEMKAHRKDLCGRCKYRKYPCGSNRIYDE
eukprot:UN03392